MMIAVLATVARAAADEAPAARARLNAIVAGLDAIERDMPTITAAAEQAARAYLDGRGLGVRGGGLNFAIGNQPGGFQDDLGLPGGADDVVLIATDDRPAARRNEAAILRTQGAMVITIGRRDVGEGLWLNNHANDVTTTRLSSPQAATLTAAVAWTLRCEMFGACVRAGRVPVIRQSDRIDTRLRRYLRYGDQRFHHDARVDAIAPGELGAAYLRELRRVLRDVGSTSWPAIAAAVDRVAVARRAGGRIFARFGPAYAAGQLQHVPRFHPLLTDTRPAPADVVIAFAHDEPPVYLDWRELDQITATPHVIWILNPYDLRPGDIARHHILINPQWPVGDALVRVPDYDTPLGAASPVVEAAILAILGG